MRFATDIQTVVYGLDVADEPDDALFPAADEPE